MKKNKGASGKRPSVFARIRLGLSRLSIRNRVFCYFLIFVALLLALLWLLQVVFLDDFYRSLKTEMLTVSASNLERNIDNADLQSLSDRISQENDVCVLVLDEDLQVLVSSEATPACILHKMSTHDLRRYIQRLGENETQMMETFETFGYRNNQYDEKHFNGPVPKPYDGGAKSMLLVRRVLLADGSYAYVFLNALVTPVNATVQTIRSQLVWITGILVVLSFLLSFLLARRITRPIIRTNEAAKELSKGKFTPVKTPVSFREVAELNQTLTQAAADLCKVEGMQRELIANISHDLRTPLTLIEGYAEVMRDLPGENTPDNMQVIIDETKRLSSLVNAVLDYSVVQSGSATIVPQAYDLTADVTSILQRYQKLTEQDGYHVEYRYDRPVKVNADPLRVGQVVYNLINNALTYTGEDKTVTVTQEVEGDEVRVSVNDSGEGIAPEDLPYIWSRYYRGSKPHKRAAIGTGLGLSIVRGIMESHGLRYGVTSQLGEGSQFWFYLPLAKEDAPADQAGQAGQAGQAEQSNQSNQANQADQ